MTRSMESRLDCPNCRSKMTYETYFERWMREERLLDSSVGVVRFDLDVLIHKYKHVVDGFGPRDIQLMMFVEVKTWGADLRMAQRDTLHILNQVMRNRRKNRHKNRDRYNAKSHAPPAEVYSPANEKFVKLFLFGGHVLTFEKNGPDDSSWIRWDKTEIDVSQLVDLLKFELNPDDPTKPLDIRRRTGKPAKDEVLF